MRDVIVVGAGMAGLVCADELVRAGLDVEVVEASMRVGGRVRTTTMANGATAELGAEFLDAHHHVVLGLLERFAIEIEPAWGPGADAVHWRGTTWRREELPAPVAADLERAEGALDELAAIVDRVDIDATPHAAELDAQSAADVLDSLQLQPLARFLLECEIRVEWMVEPHELSALHFAWALSSHRGLDHDDVEFARVRGGFSRLPEALADSIGASRITLDTPVREIAAEPDRVVVDGRPARFCVIAVPLRALRRLHVTPALPAALLGSQMGRGGKICLPGRGRPWRERGWSGGLTTDHPVGCAWEHTATRAADATVLTCLLSDEPGLRCTPADAVAHLADVLGPTGVDLDAAVRIDWGAEPGFGGTYAAFAPGQVLPAWRAVRDRIASRILLAGEHTDVFAGWVEGAARSGLRAATQITTTDPSSF